MQEIEIYTDGGCRGNPGIGAYAAIFKDRNGRDLYRLGDFSNQTTNQEMEVSAVLLAMEVITALTRSGQKYTYHIYSDSQYSVDTFNQWLDGWIMNNTIGRKSHPKLWKQVDTYKREAQDAGITVTMEHVRAHATNQGNNEVDRLVNKLMDDGKVYEIVLTNPNIRELAQKDIRNFSETEDAPAIVEDQDRFAIFDRDTLESYVVDAGSDLHQMIMDKYITTSEEVRIIK